MGSKEAGEGISPDRIPESNGQATRTKLEGKVKAASAGKRPFPPL